MFFFHTLTAFTLPGILIMRVLPRIPIMARERAAMGVILIDAVCIAISSPEQRRSTISSVA